MDRPAGSTFAVVAALMVSWMLGLAVAGSSVAGLSAAANRAVILKSLDDAHLPLGHLLVRQFIELGEQSDFPRYVDVLAAEHIVSVPAPPAAIVEDREVVAASRSVWRIVASGDSLVGNKGTGFLVARGQLMTAAHVAGALAAARSAIPQASDGCRRDQ